MKREIKFRAWDTPNKYMITHKELCLVPLTYDEVFKGKECCPLMQYTGLKDKNGVEIYSGDILSSKNCSYYVYNNKPWVGCIVDDAYGGMSLTYKEYVKDVFSLMSKPTNDAQTASWIIESCEVIGNIYENPELLEDS